MIGLMLSGVFGLFALVAFNIPPSRDAPNTSCRMDRKDPAHTVILIDQSDPFNPNDHGLGARTRRTTRPGPCRNTGVSR
jgi:hypothetical protein